MPLETDVRALLNGMLGLEPWALLLGRHGVTAATPLDVDLQVDLTAPGFGDFCARQAPLISAGDPARSLLYHCLASPAVQPAGLPESAYPSLEQIDLVENYVYSLATISESERKQLVPAVFAYEYREAAGTPHQRHADMVFGRTGIGRVGNAPTLYDRVRRAHVHAASAAHEVRVQPVRYAAFLCERLAGDDMPEQRLGRDRPGDDDRAFLVPKVKLFSGQRAGNLEFTTVELETFHFTDRLRRLFTIGELESDDKGADLDKPPFVRTTLNGGLQFQVTNLGASLLVASAPQPLVREVLISAGNSAGQVRRATTLVPERAVGVPAYNENRRYSTLRVGQSLFAAGLDYLVSEVAGEPVFRSPRNCSEFINMRHRQLSPNSPVEDLNQSIPDPATFEETLDEGGYSTVLYTDDICDGYVVAKFQDAAGRRYTAAPAFSVITAPDFFPSIGSLDIQTFAEHFKDGGASPLCEGRLRANPHLRHPTTDATIFNRDDTIAAVVSKARRVPVTAPKRTVAEVPASSSLTDGASNVFAPGWDVTYGRDGLFSSPYYHTAGLGSPFVEDAKLCASANGMWAAASPDASRTFNPERTPTAIPLTDVELGIHATSPAAAVLGVGSGWDGEYGPCFVMRGNALAVNFADILRADYVSNALRNLIRFDQLRKVSKAEMVRRLTAFQAVLKHLDGPHAVVRESRRWLVAFHLVDDWSTFSLNLIFPGTAATPFAGINEQANWGQDEGYIFAFVPRGLPSDPVVNMGRRVATVDGVVAVVAWRARDGSMASVEHGI